jgi:Flp pilus assembly protein TadG
VTVTALLHCQFRESPGASRGRSAIQHSNDQHTDDQHSNDQHSQEQRMTSGGRERRTAGDRGSLTLMLAVLFIALLALAGLVIDGGAKLDAASNAAAVAQEAARAGAGQVDRPTAYSGGTFVVDQAAARSAALAYLAAAGYQGTVATARRTMQVTVTVVVPTKMLSLIGINSFTVSESATATLVSGVTGPGA